MKLYQAKYTVVRFIPDLVKDEPINIGLVLQSTAEKYFKSKFSNKKIDKIQKINEDIKINLVKEIIKELENNFNNDNWMLRNRDCNEFQDYSVLQKLNYFYANQIQFTEPRGLITENIDMEFDKLFSELIYKESNSLLSRGIESRTMKKKFRSEFMNRGLLQNQLVVENYEQLGGFGEKLTFDFSYLNGKRNLINNISFDVKSSEPLDIAKKLLSNYYGIKKIAAKKGDSNDVDIKIIYYLPENKNDDSYSQVISCLKESSDELIDFKDEQYVKYFINKIEKEAHI